MISVKDNRTKNSRPPNGSKGQLIENKESFPKEEEKLIKIDKAKKESEMRIHQTIGYNKIIDPETKEKIVNKNFILLEKIGSGSFWNVRKVKRSLKKDNQIIDNNYYVFKKGQLNKRISLFSICPSNKERKETRIGMVEFNILKTVCNPNICRLYECIIDKSKNLIVFVMEYCDLGSLMIQDETKNSYFYNYNFIEFVYNLYFNKNNFPHDFDYIKSTEKNLKNDFENITKIVFCKLIDALKYLHNQKLIAHLDIKPDNILVKSVNSIDEENESIVKLSDFSSSIKCDSLFDKRDLMGGTIVFNAPDNEDILKSPFKSDIFSLGATIYTYLFNKFIYIGETLEFNINYKEDTKNIMDENLRLAIEACLEYEEDKRVDINQLEEIIKKK